MLWSFRKNFMCYLTFFENKKLFCLKKQRKFFEGKIAVIITKITFFIKNVFLLSNNNNNLWKVKVLKKFKRGEKGEKLQVRKSFLGWCGLKRIFWG